MRNEVVWLRVGMVVGLLGEDGKLLLTNDGSKKASFLQPRLGNTSMPSDALLLASDPINNSSRHPCNTIMMSYATWHHSRLHQDPSIHA